MSFRIRSFFLPFFRIGLSENYKQIFLSFCNSVDNTFPPVPYCNICQGMNSDGLKFILVKNSDGSPSLRTGDSLNREL